MSSRQTKRAPGPAASVAATPQLVDSRALAAGIYLVATPIGNLGDITLRALDTLRRAALVACEDTRVTGKLMHHFGLSARLTPYHEHNAQAALPGLLEAARRGVVALVSDAGTPLISDPGYRLVRAAVAENIMVTSLPGPSSVMAALTLAGLPTDRFLFGGFLPNKSSARMSALRELAHVPATLVFFETAQRIEDSLADVRAVLGNRQAALTRELTKLHENVRRGTVEEVHASVIADPPRGEIVLVIAPPDEAPPSTTEDIDTLLRAALARLSVKDAAAEVASMTGTARREVYARALLLVASP